MAYDWVAPTAGAVTGIAGIFFGWLTSRTSSRTQLALLSATYMHDSDKARRQEMRDAFAALLAQVAKVDEIIMGKQGIVYSRNRYILTSSLEKAEGKVTKDDLVAAASPEDHNTMTKFVSAILEPLLGFDAQWHEVQLVASEPVVEATGAVREDFLNICDEITDYGEIRPLDFEKRNALIEAMRADLGYATERVRPLVGRPGTSAHRSATAE